jgi:hypothetical protein
MRVKDFKHLVARKHTPLHQTDGHTIWVYCSIWSGDGGGGIDSFSLPDGELVATSVAGNLGVATYVRNPAAQQQRKKACKY